MKEEERNFFFYSQKKQNFAYYKDRVSNLQDLVSQS